MSAPRRIGIAIVGRPNVGKSTLFNRLFGRRRALVHDMPGVTRDRLEEKATWLVQGEDIPVSLIDTGGLGGDRFAEEIQTQVSLALKEADVVLCLFDGQAGVLPDDEQIVRDLQRELSRSKRRIPIIGLVNKVDAEVHETMIADFYSLGLESILTISAEHGRGMDDLKEEVVAKARPELREETNRAAYPHIAIVGRPNVGKSTLVNALLGQQRMITSPIAGTTVDSVDSLTELNGKPYVLIDTAGIRRKSKTEQGVEVLSVVQTKKALERCQVAILLLDGYEGILDQDEKIGSLIEEAGCAVILGINKWDTQKKNPKFTKETAAEIVRKKMAYLKYAPILFLSAKNGKGFEDLGDLVEEILFQRRHSVPTKEFTEWVREEVPIHNPRNAKFYLCHQTGRNPPTFVCHVNDPERVHYSLRRHLMNALRERWGYMGNPVRLHFVSGKSDRDATK